MAAQSDRYSEQIFKCRLSYAVTLAQFPPKGTALYFTMPEFIRYRRFTLQVPKPLWDSGRFCTYSAAGPHLYIRLHFYGKKSGYRA